MYVKQKMYSLDEDVVEAIFMQKTPSEDGSMWILGLGSFSVIGLSKS